MGDRIMNVELMNGQTILFSAKESEFILRLANKTRLNVHDLLLLSVLSVENTKNQSLYLDMVNQKESLNQ